MGVGAALLGSAVIGGVVSSRAVSKGAKSQERSARAGIAEERAARESFEERTEPFRQLGLDASERLTSFLEDPNQQLDEINPVVSFLRDQGFEQIQESAAAQRRLGAGGTLKDLTEFNTNLASTVAPQLQNQRFNQLFNLASLGSNAATGQGNAALSTASNIGQLQSNIGNAQANAAFGQANAITGTIGNIASTVGAFPHLFDNSGVPINQSIANNPNALGTITPATGTF